MILLDTIFYSLADLAILLFKYICVGILVFSGIQAILNYMRKEAGSHLVLGKGIAMALEFLLGSAVLHILTEPTLTTALTALIILATFAGLTILLTFAEKKTVESEAISAPVMSESDTQESETSNTNK